jgi:hypothetical protein
MLPQENALKMPQKHQKVGSKAFSAGFVDL